MLKKLVLTAAIALCAGHAGAATVTVDAQTNIFLAGDGAGSSGTGLGIAPTVENGAVFSFTPGAGLILTFASVTGQTSTSGTSGFFGADGNGGAINIVSDGGIAGMRNFRRGFLAGVFLNSSAPPVNGEQPSRLNYTTGVITNQDASFTPGVNQTFFIGDGVNNDGTTQDFFVPDGADTLVFGFLDGANFVGIPQNFFDNRGSLTAEFSITSPAVVPLPASLPLMLAGGLGLVALRRKRRS
ncbi:VPLPA-CTERM sorting domain-containing protein [Actibacterium sp. 188UL27-1]|uniref:VPLPA-CTERM sorting domain-containing protein n=1 Tax=Actibacterium sp. 188UL27-1 TaxID=2786961 RepID=UPI00195A58E9|nr:VPLPA-CTERM sorting domain-containing protein [Actibacterium sp. 188UL27-1]MBM7066900.1 VPLPA-CTERM sorting domain-containing protein [Actibacterium sp. 188UL27-1]